MTGVYRVDAPALRRNTMGGHRVAGVPVDYHQRIEGDRVTSHIPAVVGQVIDQRTAAVDAEFGHECRRTRQPSRNAIVAFQKGVRDYGDRRPRRIVLIARTVVVLRVDADRIDAPPSTHAARGGGIDRIPIHGNLAGRARAFQGAAVYRPEITRRVVHQRAVDNAEICHVEIDTSAADLVVAVSQGDCFDSGCVID